VIHRATKQFWQCYEKLPTEIRALADESFKLLKSNPQHPSLQFKKIGNVWSVRIDLKFRALAVREGDEYIWVWMGNHDEYERMLS